MQENRYRLRAAVRRGLAVLTLAAFVCGQAVQANPGDLDIEWNWGGRTFLPDTRGEVKRAFQVPNTDRTLFVIVGESPRVERREFDGRMDTSYGADGSALLPTGTVVDAATSIEGHVLLLLERAEAPGRRVFEVARLDPSGQHDQDFGTQGLVRLPEDQTPMWQSVARKVVVADHGTILVALEPVDWKLGGRPQIVTISPEGVPYRVDVLGNFEKYVVLPPRDVIVAGLFPLPGGGYIAATRSGIREGYTVLHKVSASGLADTLFGPLGTRRIPKFDATAMAVSKEGDIVLAATVTDPADPNADATAVALIGANSVWGVVPQPGGWVQSAFGGARVGIALLPRGDRRLRPVTTEFVAFDPSLPGRVIVGGHTWSPAKGKTGWSPLIERLDADGRPDASFGANGAVELDLGYGADVFNALVLGDRASRYRLTVAGSGDGRPAVSRILGGSRDDPSLPLPLFVTNSASNTTRVAAGAYVTLYFPEIPVPAGCQDLINCERFEISVEYELPRKPASSIVAAKPTVFSGTQANLVIPAAVAGSRSAVVRIIDKETSKPLAQRLFAVDPVAPAIFTRNGSGLGIPSGYVLRMAGGKQVPENLTGQVVSLHNADEVYLVLYGTGIRGASKVTALLRQRAPAGEKVVPIEVAYAGPQGDGALDQVNLRLSHRALEAAGVIGTVSLELEVSAAGLGGTTMRSNPVEIAVR